MHYTQLARKLDDHNLIASLKKAHSEERALQCYCLAMIAEVERRMLYAEAGYPSLFQYLVSVLGYSEASSLKRIQVSRLLIRFPQIFDLLNDGKVSMTVLMKLAPHTKQSNVRELLDHAIGKSVREVERMIAGIAPETPNPDQIRALDHELISIHFTADREFEELLKKAKAKLSHKYPEGKLREIFKEALSTLLEEKPKSKRSALPQKLEKHSRYIPVAVKEEVWARDEARCSFVSPDGKACGSTHFLEWDHATPFCLGGRSDNPENIRVLCRTHNRLMATQTFGMDYIEKKIRANTIDPLALELRMNRFLLDIWAGGGLSRIKAREKARVVP